MKSKRYLKKSLLAIALSSLYTAQAWADEPAQETDINDSALVISADTTKANNVSITTKSTGGEPVGIDVKGTGSLEAKNVTINISPADNTKHTNPKGIIVRGDGKTTIEELTSHVVMADEDGGSHGSPDSNAAYGVAVGYDFQGGTADQTSKLHITKSANINVENTPATVMSRLSRTFGGFIPVTIDAGHQLSGLKIFRKDGATPEFISDGVLNINVEDKSDAKVGGYLAGVYISGQGAKATFNGETTINVVANGENSAGIKIGKSDPLATEKPLPTEGASVIANGKLTLDTSKTTDSAAVRLFSNKSSFAITGKNTEEMSEIKAGNSAIVFDTQDFKAKNGSVSALFFNIKGSPSRNENSVDGSVKLHNTKLTTTHENASLILAKAEDVNDPLVSGASIVGAGAVNYIKDKFNNGKFTTKNATFELSGEKSLAEAAAKGWLIEVQAIDDDNVSDLNASIKDHATIKGLVHKEDKAVLNLSLENKATWILANNEGILPSVPITPAPVDPAATPDPAPEPIMPTPEQRATLNKLDLSADAVLDASQGSEKYFIKLTSDGTANDGKLTNDGSLITLANARYSDHLIIEGDYEGKGNARLKLNTEWNSPGDSEGANSKSDLLEITGSATGSTTIISVAADGSENIVDGSIGSIAADLNTNSTVVVRVGQDGGSAFTGKAKTTGAGELQLANRLNADGKREYFWTITSVNPQSPILDPSVPAYTLMPKVNLDLGYASLATLHERRGENRLIDWDAHQARQKYEDQTWVRYIQNYQKVEGKQRLDYNTKVHGIQIGHDFKLDYDDKGGSRLSGAYFSYLRGKSEFFDRLKSQNGVIVSDKYSGKGKSEQFALGLTSTKYQANGSYLDLVAQLSYLHNQYQALDQSKAKNKGWGLALSAEAGKPYEFQRTDKKYWTAEPQAQLIYQSLHLRSFDDDNRHVSQGNLNALRARIGVRLAYHRLNDGKAEHSKVIYGLANLWQDFGGNTQAQIGADKIQEKYGRTLGELGLGAQFNLHKDTYFYADVRYEHSLGGAKMHGYRGTAGVKFTW